MKLAAIDIGSNSIKLAVVDAAASDSFAVLCREKEAVRLAHKTLRKGYMARPALESATAWLKTFKSIAEARGAEAIIAVATASIREIGTSAQFIREVEQKTGIRVEVLSGIEEARLIGLAASRGCSQSNSTTLNIDIGGGSTEISVFHNGSPLSLFSLKLGAVRLTERFLTSNPPKPKELSNLREEIRSAFDRPARELRNTSWHHAIGTSGTILALGRILRAQQLRDVAKSEREAQPSEAEISLSHLALLNTSLGNMTLAERRTVSGMSSQRADIIVAGGQILEGAMQALQINVLKTCDWSLREGVIIDYLKEREDESRLPQPAFGEQKMRVVDAVGRRFGYEAAHAQQVARLAEKFFDALSTTENLTPHHRTLMTAAALLHDVGYHIASESHHKHSLYLIKNSELTGFSESVLAVIANIARYHRGSLPKERHTDFRVLSTADRELVCRLSGIVRLANALDRSHESRVSDLACHVNGRAVTLEIHSEFDCETELLDAERKKDLFEQAFNCNVKLSFKRIKAKRA
ncbi:MAG TPA: Ppx/GppA phosphatase family protein [Pyrinomonadaceae bacterium]|nr:Ppx/GppA phosphatase family protein [Pyrinomonadaceae bacterium]